ncbi:hypothetical protein V8C86DRAFT_2537640 [Haematococcus lacustris]
MVLPLVGLGAAACVLCAHADSHNVPMLTACVLCAHADSLIAGLGHAAQLECVTGPLLLPCSLLCLPGITTTGLRGLLLL